MKPKHETPRRQRSRRRPAMSRTEDRAAAAARMDPDNPPLDAATLARLRPVAEVAPELAAMARRRGRPKAANPKRAIKLRLSPDVLGWFRATGPGWQTRIDEALRRAAGLNKNR